MKVTALTMLVGTLAISGVPLFSGFTSKDAVLASALHFTVEQPEHILLFLLPVVGATSTAFYMCRLWFLIFAGSPRGPAAARATENGRLITGPLIALAIPSIFVGWRSRSCHSSASSRSSNRCSSMASRSSRSTPGGAAWWALGRRSWWPSIGIALGTLFYGPWTGWRKLDPRRTALRFGPIHEFLVHKWHFDELYRAVFVGPTMAFARALSWFDRTILDGLVDGSAKVVERFSRLEGGLRPDRGRPIGDAGGGRGIRAGGPGPKAPVGGRPVVSDGVDGGPGRARRVDVRVDPGLIT